jgi:hypothetical protein
MAKCLAFAIVILGVFGCAGCRKEAERQEEIAIQHFEDLAKQLQSLCDKAYDERQQDRITLTNVQFHVRKWYSSTQTLSGVIMFNEQSNPPIKVEYVWWENKWRLRRIEAVEDGYWGERDYGDMPVPFVPKKWPN